MLTLKAYPNFRSSSSLKSFPRGLVGKRPLESVAGWNVDLKHSFFDQKVDKEIIEIR